jgi:hypothetical protein
VILTANTPCNRSTGYYDTTSSTHSYQRQRTPQFTNPEGDDVEN